MSIKYVALKRKSEMSSFDRELTMESELSGNSYITELLTKMSPGLIYALLLRTGAHFPPAPPQEKSCELVRNPSSTRKKTAVFIRKQKRHYNTNMPRCTRGQQAATRGSCFTGILLCRPRKVSPPLPLAGSVPIILKENGFLPLPLKESSGNEGI